MSTPNNPPGPLRFMDATIVRSDLVFILSQVHALNEDGVDHTKVLRWKNGSWAHYMLDWSAVSVVHLTRGGLSVLSMGLDGQVHVASGTSKWIENVDLSREGPANRGPLREMRVVAGECFVAGMQRQAYRRTGRDLWERWDTGTVLPLNASQIVSFDSIDGFARDDLYAVGLDGAIWRRIGANWAELDSPTSVGLEKVLCVAPDRVYAAGQMGTLLEIQDGAVHIIDTQGVRETFWDLCMFRGALYLSTSTALYRWRPGDWQRLDLGLGDNWSFGSLACNDQVIWSVGRTRLAMSDDGDNWVDTTCLDDSY